MNVSAQLTCTIKFIAVDSTTQQSSTSPQNLSPDESEQASTDYSVYEDPDFLQMLQEAQVAEAPEAEITSEGTILSSSFANEESGLTSEENENLFESGSSLIGEEGSSTDQSETIGNYVPSNFTAAVQVLTAGAENATSWSFSNGNDQIFYIEYSGEICNCWIELDQDAYNQGQNIILHIDYNQTRDGPNSGGLDLRNYTDAYPNCTEFNWSNQVSSYNIWCYNLR